MCKDKDPFTKEDFLLSRFPRSGLLLTIVTIFKRFIVITRYKVAEEEASSLNFAAFRKILKSYIIQDKLRGYYAKKLDSIIKFWDPLARDTVLDEL